MSIKKSKKHIQAKKAREKEVKKRINENRVILRKERRLELERERAYEIEFAKKSEENLSNEERLERLKNNVKILEALESEYDKEKNISQEQVEKLNKQFEATGEYQELQTELYTIFQEKEALKTKGELTDEKSEEIKSRLDKIGKRIEDLGKIRQENIIS
jgi:hypothetical protein